MIETDLCGMVAKRNCKVCNGRGYIDIEQGKNFSHVNRYYCKCVIKNMNQLKELKVKYQKVLKTEGDSGKNL